VHRRVDTVTFLDSNRVARRTSIDFTIPKRRFLPVEFRTGRSIAFIPLTLLSKRVLRNFDLRDAAGVALPTLTQDQNGAIAAAMLRQEARRVLGHAVDEHIQRDVDDLAFGTSGEIEAAVQNLQDPRGQGSHDDRRQLWKSVRFRTLARDLARQFILFVPLEESPGARQVIKLAYEEPVGSRGRTFREMLALTPLPFAALAPTIGMAESYHFEIEPPDGVMIASATLYRVGAGEREEELARERSVFRAHLHVRDMPRGAVGIVLLRFRLRRAGLPLAALTTGAASTGILLAGWLLHYERVHATGELAGALLVAIPGLFATYLARPEEHGLLKRLAGGLRALMLLFATASFAAAGALAAGLTGYTRSYFWGIGAIACGAGSAVIAAGLLLSWYRDWSEEGREAT
jgi:hypothetical protein